MHREDVFGKINELNVSLMIDLYVSLRVTFVLSVYFFNNIEVPYIHLENTL